MEPDTFMIIVIVERASVPCQFPIVQFTILVESKQDDTDLSVNSVTIPNKTEIVASNSSFQYVLKMFLNSRNFLDNCIAS